MLADLSKKGELIASLDASVPFTILAFFPEYQMKDTRAPTTNEMIAAFEIAKAKGLKRVRLGNLGVFVKTSEEKELLMRKIGKDGL